MEGVIERLMERLMNEEPGDVGNAKPWDVDMRRDKAWGRNWECDEGLSVEDGTATERFMEMLVNKQAHDWVNRMVSEMLPHKQLINAVQL